MGTHSNHRMGPRCLSDGLARGILEAAVLRSNALRRAADAPQGAEHGKNAKSSGFCPAEGISTIDSPCLRIIINRGGGVDLRGQLACRFHVSHAVR
jgi:hypothetical protein